MNPYLEYHLQICRLLRDGYAFDGYSHIGAWYKNDRQMKQILFPETIINFYKNQQW
jgi:hypothetical protein